MTEDRSGFISTALEDWRLRDVERDWEGVVARATATAHPRQAERVRGVVARRWSYRRRLAFAVVGLALAAPAIAAVSGSIRWPETRGPGAQLGASVPSLPGTTLRIDSHGGLVIRTSHGIRFMSRVARKQHRRFLWQLQTRTRITAAAIALPHAANIELCSPCTGDDRGAFALAGARALDILNGHAKLRIQRNGQMTTSPIRLHRLR